MKQISAIMALLITYQSMYSMQQQITKVTISSFEQSLIAVGAVAGLGYAACWYSEYKNRQQQRLKLIQAQQDKLSAEEQFRKYAAEGDEDALNKAIKDGIDIDAQCPRTGNTALIEATINNQIITMALLISRGADMNKLDSLGKTAEYYAEQYGYISITRLFKRYRAEAEMRRDAWQGNRELIKQALYDGVNIDAQDPQTGKTPLMFAMCARKADIVRLLLSHGARTDIYDYAGRATRDHMLNRDGDDPIGIGELFEKHARERLFRLHAEKGNKEALKKMLEEIKWTGPGVIPTLDVNAQDPFSGETALICAVKNNHKETVELFFDLYCKVAFDLTIQDHAGLTARDWATRNGLVDIVRLINREEFMSACSTYDLKKLKLILDTYEVDINEQPIENKWTMLIAAVSHCKPEIVELLLSYGARIDLRDNDGKSLLTYDLDEFIVQNDGDADAKQDVKQLIESARRAYHQQVLEQVSLFVPHYQFNRDLSVAAGIVNEYLFAIPKPTNEEEAKNTVT